MIDLLRKQAILEQQLTRINAAMTTRSDDSVVEVLERRTDALSDLRDEIISELAGTRAELNEMAEELEFSENVRHSYGEAA